MYVNEQNPEMKSEILIYRKSDLEFTTVNELSSKPTKHVPIETRVFYGVTYSVGVVEGGFKVFIGDREDPMEEVIPCPDVSADDSKELLVRAHTYARKLILEKQGLSNRST